MDATQSNPSLRQKALIASSPGTFTISDDVPIPVLEPDMVLVRNQAVALNPVDVNTIDNFSHTGVVGGFDFAGEIIALGADATSISGLHVGDRVCGSVHGSNNLRPTEGAFATYVGTIADLTMRIPASMSVEAAATLPVGVGTVGLALRSLGLTLDSSQDNAQFVLVYGGSTATGTLAIQLLKLAGHRPITTCSPQNNSLVERYGAEKVFDYRSAACASDIREYTANRLKYVLDCISETSTMELCYSTIRRGGGRYTALAPYSQRVARLRPTIKADWVFQPMLFGRVVDWPKPFDRAADASTRTFGRAWFRYIQDLLEAGKLLPHPFRVGEGGFSGIIEGIDIVRRKAVSGEKLVYKIPPM